MWALHLLSDFLGSFPILHVFVGLCYAIAGIFIEDEKGNMYAGGRAAGTLATMGAEQVIGWVGLGFLPLYTLRMLFIQASSWFS